jgi:hypothetical protein
MSIKITELLYFPLWLRRIANLFIIQPAADGTRRQVINKNVSGLLSEIRGFPDRYP